MGVNTTGLLNTQTEVYASYKNDAVTKNETAAKKDSTAKTEEKNESGVVYDKSDSSKDNKKATYSINKMSAEDRAALVQQMKADTQSRQQQLTNIVKQMMGQQVRQLLLLLQTEQTAMIYGSSLQKGISRLMQQQRHRRRRISPKMAITE